MGLPPNPQAAAQHQAAALRQNMATLAGLSPAQLQALTHQPALAQALLQSRVNNAATTAGANGGGGGKMGRAIVLGIVLSKFPIISILI